MANKLPTSVYSIIVVEFLECYSYYAMRAILTMYFSESLHLSDSTSVSFFLYTSALAYFTPCVGGYLSDSRWGKFATISRFGSIYVVGFLVLSFSALQSKMSGTMIGLVLIGIGTGGIKPCVSSFGADQLPDPNDEKKLRKYFSTFYFAINVGALLSYIVSPLVRQVAGYGAAFFLPAVFMTLALVVFIRGKPTYIINLPKNDRKDADSSTSTTSTISTPPSSFPMLGNVVWTALCTPRVSPEHDGKSFLQLAGPSCSETQIKATVDFFRTFKFVMIMPFFWMLYDQQGSVWILQAKRLDMGSFLQPENMGAFNTLLVLVLLPLFEKFLYPALERIHLEVTALRRMSCGMVLASVAFFMSAILERAISKSFDNSISVFWQLPQYAVLTVAEIGVSTTGLEFFYAEAPPAYKTATASLFLLTTAFGDMFGGVLYSLANVFGETAETILFVCAMFMLVASFFFIREAKVYIYRKGEIEGESEPESGIELAESKHLIPTRREGFDMSSVAA
ncbi:hypothetical protein ScalyP_jg2676 [Parmales sp. scaly parma]|nr:hypothetical protein ScalyP_jg2676 [Parmales sp. scaly parma]